MGIKQKLLLLIIGSTLLSGCDFNTANIDIAQVPLVKAIVDGAEAYYLSEDGTLYSPGADSDASCYVLYKDSKKGIVATNVKDFGLLSWGGYYIDNNYDLYIWNRWTIPLYNCNQEKSHTKVLSNVRDASVTDSTMFYIDTNNNLYFVGELYGESYSLEHPKCLGENVITFEYCGDFVIWSEQNQPLKFWGNTEDCMLDMDKLQEQFKDDEISYILSYMCSYSDNLLILQEGKLWFYGDYQKLITGESSGNEPELLLLKEDIIDASLSIRTLVAVDTSGVIYLWGSCISNGIDNTEEPYYEYYESYPVATNGKSVYASDREFCYVDQDGKFRGFHTNLAWNDFYGNSTNDTCVGINREPVTWE